MSDLLELVARCEGDVPSPFDLSRAIGEALNDHAAQRYEHPGSQNESWPRYASSVDDAMALVNRKMVPGILDLLVTWDTMKPETQPAVSVRWYPEGKSGAGWHAQTATAKTPALAICAVLMKALHANGIQKASADE